LGGKYKENLDRLVDRIVRNPKTANLQFANNIASVGGIGFFTHSATKTPDERYLEVVLGAPETFETKGDYSAKIYRLFSVYGTDLLSILASDSDIAQEKEVSGYGLNFAWRNIAQEASGSRVVLERAVVYFPKDKARAFLRHEIDHNKFLAEGIIFAVEEDGPMNLVSYRPQVVKPDFRPPIREENLAVGKLEADPGASLSKAPIAEAEKSSQSEKTADKSAEQAGLKEKEAPSAGQSSLAEKKPETGILAAGAEKLSARAGSPAPAIVSSKQDKSSELKVAELVRAEKGSDAKKPSEKKLETIPAVTAEPTQAVDTNKSTGQKSEPSTIAGGRRNIDSGLDQIPTKSKEPKAAPAKVTEVIPEKIVSSKIAQAETAGEPTMPPQKPAESKTLADKQSAGKARAALDLEPAAKISSEPKQSGSPVATAPAQAVKKEAAPQMAAKLPVEVTKAESTSGAPKPESIPSQVAPAKSRGVEAAKTENSVATTPQQIIVPKTEAAKPSAPSAEAKKIEPSPAASKPEVKTAETKPAEQVPALQRSSESQEQPRSIEKKKEPHSEVSVSETKPAPLVSAPVRANLIPTPAGVEPAKSEKVTELKSQPMRKAEASKAPVQPVEKKVETPSAAARPSQQTKPSENMATTQKAAEPREPLRPVEKEKNDQAPTGLKSEVKLSESKPAPPARIQAAPTPIPAAPPKPAGIEPKSERVAEVKPEPVAKVEAAKSAAQPQSSEVKRIDPASATSMPLKPEAKIQEAKPAPQAAAQSQQDKIPEKSSGEQIALLKNKAVESVPEKKPLARPVPRILEGFIIQLAFTDKPTAQRWAETLERRGYAVSVTEASGAGSLRVRFGNFAVRDEAERQLRSLRQEGVSGIIINLPQAYRPEARSLDVDGGGKSVSAAQ
jgi:hypothetical protein